MQRHVVQSCTRQPLLDWAVITPLMRAGVLANGEPFVWKARRHRKGRGITGQFVKDPPRPFAWMDPRPFLHGGPITSVRYCSALLLMIGASIFSFSNAVQLSAQVRAVLESMLLSCSGGCIGLHPVDAECHDW